MKDTKQRILEAALDLFNREGLNHTTLRGIAQHLGMSQGNLNYHFKLKEEIVEALYYELVQKMNERVQNLSNQSNLLGMVYASSVKLMEQMIAYRFVFRDFYLIIKTYPNIRTHYEGLIKQRKQEFTQIFSTMISVGLIRNEAFPEEYDRVFYRMAILADNWINTLETFDLTSSVDEKMKFYARILFETLFPYLTEFGKQAWDEIQW